MKKLFFLALLTALLSPACEKDPIDIQEDLCKGVICNNGGYCVNGDCQCPPQWTGPSCAQEVAPIKMRVQTIRVKTFPPTDQNGGGWDLFDGPDVYIAIWKDGTYLYTSSIWEDAQPGANWAANFEFTDPTATYSISVWDYDDGITADDPMGGINFTPYISGQSFPVVKTIECAGCNVSFDFLGISYFH